MLLQKMAEILESSRASLPEWAQDWLPGDGADLREQSVSWLRAHATEIRTMGGVAGRAIAYALVGMVVGALIALYEMQPEHRRGPLARAMTRCATRVADAFRRVVFAQVRIAALNTLLTGVYLGIALPVLGMQLPFAKTMIALTFVFGLLPIIGNLISNTMIVVVSLSHSPQLAVASLAFLVVIHKLEYFVNARIVGIEIDASAWELLLAMIVMEAAFGLPGVIAAPVFYAYVKSELSVRGLV
jgi:predicted PurR-regulated permease PerM